MRQSYMNGGKAKTPPINPHSCTDTFYCYERGAHVTAGATATGLEAIVAIDKPENP
jgi:hypothetical protein